MTNLYKGAKANRYKRNNLERGLCEMCPEPRAPNDARFCVRHRTKQLEARRMYGKIKRGGGAVG